MKQEIINQIKDAVIERLGDGYEVDVLEVWSATATRRRSLYHARRLPLKPLSTDEEAISS